MKTPLLLTLSLLLLSTTALRAADTSAAVNKAQEARARLVKAVAVGDDATVDRELDAIRKIFSANPDVKKAIIEIAKPPTKTPSFLVGVASGPWNKPINRMAQMGLVNALYGEDIVKLIHWGCGEILSTQGRDPGVYKKIRSEFEKSGRFEELRAAWPVLSHMSIRSRKAPDGKETWAMVSVKQENFEKIFGAAATK